MELNLPLAPSFPKLCTATKPPPPPISLNPCTVLNFISPVNLFCFKTIPFLPCPFLGATLPLVPPLQEFSETMADSCEKHGFTSTVPSFLFPGLFFSHARQTFFNTYIFLCFFSDRAGNIWPGVEDSRTSFPLPPTSRLFLWWAGKFPQRVHILSLLFFSPLKFTFFLPPQASQFNLFKGFPFFPPPPWTCYSVCHPMTFSRYLFPSFSLCSPYFVCGLLNFFFLPSVTPPSFLPHPRPTWQPDHR